MGSPLDFANSESFRRELIVKNLKPYNKSPFPAQPPTNYEYTHTVKNVVDTPDSLIDEPSFANQLYPLNQYGNEGGYKQVPDPNGLLNKKSNEGEYGFQDANILDQGYVKSQEWKSSNKYSTGTQLPLDSAPFFESLNQPPGYVQGANNQPYYPQSFVASSYSPVSILLNPDPLGSDGLLSQDSFIVKLGAFTLRREFEDRIAAQIQQDTIGRANIFAVNSATDVYNLITGQVPLIQPNWSITQPENPVVAATDFILRLAGSVIPFSPIPGSYFDPNATYRQPTTTQQLGDAFRGSVVGNIFTTLAGTNLTGSEIFYNNTGPGQKAQLFKNIDYNRYKPSFDRTLFNRVAGAVVGSTTDNSNFYIGSNTSNPGTVLSPAGQLPVNEYGVESEAPVYGPDAVAKLYEPLEEQIKIGSNGPNYTDGGAIEGGLTWVSPKYKGNAGKKVGLGGEIANQDENFSPSSYSATESTNYQFKPGSILYDTQKLIDSQPQGGKRLQHVGNAIDQVSKVFNDGYKELTKGSRVLSYVGAIGQEVGSEYCRVFAKDIPYLQYSDLQKTDGIVTEGRRFSWSVLDKTYNLNIAPNKQEGGQSSSNLINGPGGTSTNVAFAKKYMFSIENLAWRTSSTPGYTVADLPICERGPNGGRVMWFPPYDLTFDESVTTRWKENSFLGRPEPIYTYENTSRTGSVSWKIVVDHPSVLNLIVNKVLGNETNKVRINGIIDSFFAGCRKYDLYELAQKYYMINPNDLFQLQQKISSKETTVEQLQYIKQTISTGSDSPNGSDQPIVNSEEVPKDKFKQFTNLGFYFGNDFPTVNNQNYTIEFNRYTGSYNRSVYAQKPTATQTTEFFDKVVIPNFSQITGFTQELTNILGQTTGQVTIDLKSSCSAPASELYNIELSKRRIESAIAYFESTTLKKYIDEKRLLFNTAAEGEVSTVVVPKLGDGTSTSQIFCSDTSQNVVGGDTVGSKDIFTYNAMACRSVVMRSITHNLQFIPTPVNPPKKEEPGTRDVLVGNVVVNKVKEPVIEQEQVYRDNITKRVLRSLLSECDYFETIKQETPMVFDNLKDKLKFFDPAFHSMTPEGLNSRLTFLQQCMRPGDTIPTVKDVNGTQTLQYNNATNTSFGTPPVCVLRVGDFFHTKITPTSLTLKYEQLDLNPEGIGVQPMIATVTMAFNFVGGHGLKNAIDKLQNALTFNYYANTEIWDDRADVTDDSYKVYDQQFLQNLNITLPTKINQATSSNGQSNLSPIGVVLSSATDQYTTGDISYSDFMVKLKDDTQTYFQTVVNKQKEITQQYNNAIRQIWQSNRKYYDGRFYVSVDKTKIFGKPENTQQNIDKIFNQMLGDIDNDPFILHMNESSRNIDSKVLRQLKQNYVNFIQDKKSTYINAATTITQSVATTQQSFVQTLQRVNTVTYKQGEGFGTDGFQDAKGNVVVYVTKGTDKINAASKGVTNTLEELVEDVRTIRNNMDQFNLILESGVTFSYNSTNYTGRLCPELSNGKQVDFSIDNVFTPFSTKPKFEDITFRRQYAVLSENVVDDKKYQAFKNALINNIINNKSFDTKNLEESFNQYWISIAKPLFIEENAVTIFFIENMEKNQLKTYLNFTPFDKKERVFTFSTEPIDDTVKRSQTTLVASCGASGNVGSNPLTWDDEFDNEVFISKVNFN